VYCKPNRRCSRAESGEWRSDGRPRKVATTPPPRVFCKKRLQAVENKGRECGKEGKEKTKRL